MDYELPNHKPYAFVPLADAQALRQARRAPPGHERLRPDRFSGWLDLELETLRPLQVASGRMDFVSLEGQEILATFPLTVRRGEVLIPGSSWKGTVRSLVEAISPSCVSQDSFKSRPHIPNALRRCRVSRDSRDLCPACGLLGTQDVMSRVAFRDISIEPQKLQVVGTPLLWTPARTQQLPPIYLQGQSVRGRKFYRHGQVLIDSRGDTRLCIGEGLCIPARVEFVNLSEAETGLLIAALGLHPEFPFPIKIGGGKPVGLGSVRVRLNRVYRWDPATLRSSGRVVFQAVADLETRLSDWVKQAERDGLLLREALRRLAEILNERRLRDPFHQPY